MTIADLIRELQAYPPQKPVRVVMSEVYFRDESGESMVNVDESEATEADSVRDEGPYVLIRGR